MNLTPPNIYLLDTVIEKKELLQRANIALNFLTNKSLPPGSFILVDASVGVDIFPWFLACITKQYCLVPISSFAAKNKEQLAYYFSLFKKNVFIDSTFSLKPVSSLEEEIILPALKDVPNNFWATIMSSGSTGAQKAVVLTKENFLASAMAHAKHHGNFGLWLNALPLYHVGGLSVFTRALLLGQDIAYTEKFSPDLLVRWIDAHPIHTPLWFPPCSTNACKIKIVWSPCEG